MIDSRRWPKMACASCSMPSPSGPRCRRACIMRCMPSERAHVLPTIPAIPHILILLQARRGAGHVRGDRALEEALVALGAAVDEKILHLGEVGPLDERAALRIRAQSSHGIIERHQVIERDHLAGLRTGEKV